MKRKLDLTKHKIWKDKSIKPETKEIYAYLYSQGFNKTITHVNIGNIQQILSITNVGFRNNLKILEKFKYIVFKEYNPGMYEIHVY